MKTVLYVIGAIVLVLIGLKILGLDDVISKVGSKVRAKAGMTARNKQENGKSAMSKEVFGWDIKDVQSKPDVVIRSAKEKLQQLINDLEETKFSSKVIDKRLQSKNRESQQELEDLRESIRAAKAYLEDENTKYPVKIKTYTYPNKAVLQASVGTALSRYNALKRAAEYVDGVNSEARSVQQIANVNQRLDIARAIMAELDAKLDLATVKVQEDALKRYKKDLDNIDATQSPILSPEDEGRLPSGVTSDKDRIDRMLRDFND